MELTFLFQKSQLHTFGFQFVRDKEKIQIMTFLPDSALCFIASR